MSYADAFLKQPESWSRYIYSQCDIFFAKEKLKKDFKYLYTTQMTKEQLEEKITQCKETGIYVPVASIAHFKGYKQWISQVLSKIEDAKIIDVYCSPQAKMYLLHNFWVNDFNYLGTRLRLIKEESLTEEFSTLAGFEEKYKILFICDGVGVAYIETVY